MRQGWTATALSLVLAACAAARRPAVPPPPPSSARLTVTLGWTEPVDLDLYVTEPSLETAYYANAHTRSGGAFDGDARCADGAGGVRYEEARWTRPPAGRYRVGVDFPEVCSGRRREVGYAVFVDLDGRREQITGRARLVERQPQLLEFVVPEPEVPR
jgi:uncharacterized protein YfaP (DUF2135 family)